MITVFFLICFFDGTAKEPVSFTGTELYKPIRTGDVAVSPSGHIYIVDFDGARIAHYAPNGERLPDIGKKGQGPGEFSNPGRAHYTNGHLYVFDFGDNQMSMFTEEGTFVKKISPPERRLDIMPVAGGWLYGNWRFSMDPEKPITLHFAGPEFENPVLIEEWPRNNPSGNLNIESDGSGVIKAPYSPVREQTMLTVSADGLYAFISDPGKISIRVLDIKARKFLDKIVRDEPVIPFNEEWGMAQLEKFKEGRPADGMQLVFEPAFPKTFPMVRNIFPTLDGNLVISRWPGNPDQQTLAIAVDRKGNDVPLPYQPGNASRIMAMADGWLYVSTFDEEEEEAGLIKCRPSDVDKVVSENPINFEGFAGRLVVRMN